MFYQELRDIWGRLQAKKSQYSDYLEHVTIDGLRGIYDVSIELEYPVTVLAGPNGCGKSTFLFAMACAYQVPEAKLRDFKPSSLFPDLRSTQNDIPMDEKPVVSIEYYYKSNGKRFPMLWRRLTKNWNRSHKGQEKLKQPERDVFLRTLSSLSNPAEIRGVLFLGRKDKIVVENIDSSLIAMAARLLPNKYDKLVKVGTSKKDILFAYLDEVQHENPGEQVSLMTNPEPRHVSYSEFHMSAGERAMLRLSADISQLKNALILIDEIEASLHPGLQERLMLELQRLALRNNLQIVIATHSPVVINSVPVPGRVYLDRVDGKVQVLLQHRDIIAKALYGSTNEQLSILCEDETAEGILRGIFDYLNPKLNFRVDDINIGRDTSKDKFSEHIKALNKFNKIEDFIFVLDGDAREIERKLTKLSDELGRAINYYFLPGEEPPEAWIWNALAGDKESYSVILSCTPEQLSRFLDDTKRLYESAATKLSETIKNQLGSLADKLGLSTAVLARKVGEHEAKTQKGAMKGFVDEIKEAVNRWRELTE